MLGKKRSKPQPRKEEEKFDFEKIREKWRHYLFGSGNAEAYCDTHNNETDRYFRRKFETLSSRQTNKIPGNVKMLPQSHKIFHNILLVAYAYKVLKREKGRFIDRSDELNVQYSNLLSEHKNWKGDVEYNLLDNPTKGEPELDLYININTKDDRQYMVICEFKCSPNGDFNGAGEQLKAKRGTNRFDGKIYYVGAHAMRKPCEDATSSYYPENIPAFEEKVFHVEDSTVENYEILHQEKNSKPGKKEHNNGYRRPGSHSKSYSK